ncbi:zinc finger protein 343-like isoform X3 [Daphnia pulex]|uniref:zinc finger protein 343-like isoform X3 n=1 Tax=Daphnia pulex TaxID=6669 RepID=UPI001EE0C7FA|nr:zinc finger protein 343-like isoform X3 [Daphnia pulex]
MSNKSSNDSFLVETMQEDYDVESSSEVHQEYEEGEVLQDAELVCVNQEDMDRIDAAEEEAADNEFSSPNYSHQKAKRKDLLRYHIVSCQEELEELRNQSANEDMLIDPKDKLHLVKYVKIEGRILKLWECGICAKDFRHQYTLMRHLPTHTDERKFVCDVCDKAFRQMSTLSQHRAIHSNARPYVCEVCQKTFNRVSTLISHRRTHFDDKPHKCHVCGKGFHQKGNLKNHLFSHSNERPYRCEICGRGFNQMSNLVVHKMKLHGQASPADGSTRTAQSDKFSCKLCNEKFSKKTLLTSHEEETHNLIKPRSSTSRRGRLPSSNRKPVQVAVASESVTIKSPGVTNSSSKVVHSKNENGSTAGLLIDAIQTPSMHEARITNQTAFALLKSIDGTPSLVKIFDLPNNKQLLISATSEDLAESAQKSAQVDPSCKPSQVKVAVVATVSQHMDEDGQLVVRIESIDVDQKVLDSIETPCRQENAVEISSFRNEVANACEVTSDLENEQVHFVRPLPDGGFEIVADTEAANFLEIVEEDSSRSCDASNNSSMMDSAQIIITQDEDGHLMLEGTPLQYLLEANNQQQLQFVLNNSKRK